MTDRSTKKMSPRSKEQFEEIRQRSKKAIKEAALELFGHLGYHSTSISRIAREAGVSKGLLYNYFESKEALLEEILMDAAAIGDRILEEVLTTHTEPREILEAIIRTSFQFLRGDLHYWKLLTAVAFQTEVLEEHVPKLREKQIESQEGMIQLFEQMGHPDARREGIACSALLDGIVIQLLQMGDRFPLDDMEAYLVERYCTVPKYPKK